MAPRTRRPDDRRGRRRLRIENLERRELLAVTLTDDVLRIEGTADNDTTAIDPYTYQDAPWVAVTLNGDTTQYAASADAVALANAVLRCIKEKDIESAKKELEDFKKKNEAIVKTAGTKKEKSK